MGEVEDLRKRRTEAAAACTRWLFWRGDTAPERLRTITASATGDDIDRYGAGGAVAELEAEVAELLGKPAAVFMPSGVMAQQSVLRALADDRGTTRVALHGLSHFVKHELNALEEMHGLRLEHLTGDPRQPRPDDLDAIPGRLAAVALELPLRDAGHVLPTWDELVLFARHCAERGVPLHLDGARLWESVPYLGHSAAEIAALAETVYVSFYKALGGLSGAVVAGPVEVIAQARRWQRRLGGNLFTMLPYAVSARTGLRELAPRMAEFHTRAGELAKELTAAGFRVYPEPPHTNAFRVFAERDAVRLNTAAVERMERTRESICPGWTAADVPGWSWTEVAVGPVTMDWPVREAVEALSELLRD
jgi:threonine aldolase